MQLPGGGKAKFRRDKNWMLWRSKSGRKGKREPASPKREICSAVRKGTSREGGYGELKGVGMMGKVKWGGWIERRGGVVRGEGRKERRGETKRGTRL